MIANWKTSLAGIGALLVVVGHVIGDLSAGGGISASDISGLIAAIGLIAAKDAKAS